MPTERGTTLLEMLVVLSVLGTLAGLGIMLTGGRAEREADVAARRVAEQLRSLRSEAISRGRAVWVEAGDAPAPAGLEPADRRRLGTSARPPTVRVSPGQPIIFYADGSARASSVEVLREQSVRRIEIDWTGAVDVVAAR